MWLTTARENGTADSASKADRAKIVNGTLLHLQAATSNAPQVLGTCVRDTAWVGATS